MNIKMMLVLLLMVNTIQAQEFKLGKVTVEELQEKQHPKDPSAAAAILYKYGRTYFTYDDKRGYVMNHEFTYRIKIYKKEGLDWATFEVPYRIGYENLNDDYLSFYDAATYNLENGSVVKTKLNSEWSFKTKVNENWKNASITLPNVKEGSVIEFRYKLKSENVFYFPAYEIQYEIPVNYSEYKTEIPSSLHYKTILKGFVAVKTDSKYESGSFHYADKDSQTISVGFQSLNSTFISKDVPAIKAEEYVDNLDNYKASILNELEKTSFNNGRDVKDYSATWEGVAQTIFKIDDFGKQLSEIDYLLSDIKVLLKNVDSEEERLKIVFKFVQETMNWNHDYGYFTDKGVVKAYADRTGNVAEINFILISMLRLARINADPVLISTIRHGIPVFPSRAVFNYVVALAEVNGKQILLDATRKHATQNILPLEALNWEGRLIKPDGTSRQIDLFPTSPSVDNIFLMAKVNESGQVSGDIKSRKTNYDAYKFRETYGEINTDSYLEKLENAYSGIEISNYTIGNKNTDLLKPIDESFSFKSTNHAEVIGGKIFLNPMLLFTLYKNPFLQEKREMPIYFGYPTQKKYVINIEIPEGYEIESLPNGINLSTGDGSLSFKCFIEKTEAKIQVSVQSDSKNAIVSADNYLMLKDFYKKIVAMQNEKIVLKKI